MTEIDAKVWNETYDIRISGQGKIRTSSAAYFRRYEWATLTRRAYYSPPHYVAVF